MTCKSNCIHFNDCSNNGVTKYYGTEIAAANVEKLCERFKSKAENIKIIIHIEADPDTEIIGIKEDFAAYCEKFGDVKRIDVESE